MENVRIRLPRNEWFYNPARPLGPPGGFGEVFEGQDAEGEIVAVKRLKVTVGEAAHRELKIADDLAGKSFLHVLEVLDAGEDSESDGYYVIMPRAERSLSDELNKRGKLTIEDATDILRQIAERLKEIDNLLVHRDLKPGNVLLHDGKWKIADFGIARFVEDATSSNTVRGFLSAPFAAPEQWRGEHATHATDIYAFSCMAYVLLKGEPPFPGPSKEDFRRQHISDTPPPLASIDPRLRTIFAAGLRKPQAGRPPIDRVIAVLREAYSNPSPKSLGIGALHAANATEAERLSAATAKGERERQEAAERRAIVDAGESILRQILKRFEDSIVENASEARVQISHDQLGVRMGHAELTIKLQGAAPPNISLRNGTWKVSAIGLIRVTQGTPEWSYGATLWYMQSGQNSNFRWYEVAYQRHALMRGALVGPFPIQDIGNDIYQHASLAAGPGMHEIIVDFGPAPIDDEDEEPFVQRWLERFAQAYSGRLCPFN